MQCGHPIIQYIGWQRNVSTRCSIVLRNICFHPRDRNLDAFWKYRTFEKRYIGTFSKEKKEQNQDRKEPCVGQTPGKRKWIFFWPLSLSPSLSLSFSLSLSLSLSPFFSFPPIAIVKPFPVIPCRISPDSKDFLRWDKIRIFIPRERAEVPPYQRKWWNRLWRTPPPQNEDREGQ